MCIKICDCYLYGCWTRYRGITKDKNNIHSTHFAHLWHKLTFCRSFSFRDFFQVHDLLIAYPILKDPGLICVHWLGWNARVSLELNRENSRTCKTTNWTHTSLVLSAELACSAIPAARLKQLLYHWTTQRLPTIERTKHFSKTCSKPYFTITVQILARWLARSYCL